MLDDDDEWDFWDNAKTHCIGYNAQIDSDALNVLRGIAAKKFNTEISKDLELPPQYVELLQSIFCSMDWCEYGTSPRGCWIIHKLVPGDLISKMVLFYEQSWKQTPPPYPK